MLLVITGLLSIFSVDSVRHLGVFKKQLVFVALGLIPFTIFWRSPLQLWQKLSGKLYVLNLIFLALVFLAPRHAKGAGRWIDIGPFDFQPSEFTKLALIIGVAAYFAERRHQIKEWKTFAGSFLYILPSAVLIFRQPHLGATGAVLAVWFSICLIAGVPGKTLGLTIGGVLALVVAVLLIKPDAILKPYQIDRVHALMSRQKGTADNSAEDYQVHEALKAFANGGLSGSGYLKGEQKRLGFIPEQHNDFIFTVVAEEGGLIGGGIVLSIFCVLFVRMWSAMVRATDPFAQNVATGIITILAFHTIVNLGMNIGILPVVGLWLPFLSYGGTALWLCMSLVGLALAVSSQNQSTNF